MFVFPRITFPLSTFKASSGSSGRHYLLVWSVPPFPLLLQRRNTLTLNSLSLSCVELHLILNCVSTTILCSGDIRKAICKQGSKEWWPCILDVPPLLIYMLRGHIGFHLQNRSSEIKLLRNFKAARAEH